MATCRDRVDAGPFEDTGQANMAAGPPGPNGIDVSKVKLRHNHSVKEQKREEHHPRSAGRNQFASGGIQYVHRPIGLLHRVHRDIGDELAANHRSGKAAQIDARLREFLR